MTDAEMSILLETSDRLVADATVGFHRYLYGAIDWNEDVKQ